MTDSDPRLQTKYPKFDEAASPEGLVEASPSKSDGLHFALSKRLAFSRTDSQSSKSLALTG